jgi:hypothetical protein
MQIAEKNLEKDTREHQKHRKRQQKLNTSDLQSTFNAFDRNGTYIFGER